MIKLFFNTVSLFLLVFCGYALSSTPLDETEKFSINLNEDGDIVTLFKGGEIFGLRNIKKDPLLVEDVLDRGTLRDVKNLFEKAREIGYEINLVDLIRGKGDVPRSSLNAAQVSSIDPVAKINYLMPMYTDDMLSQVLREPQFFGGRYIVDNIFFTLVDQLKKGIYDKEFVDNVLRSVRLSQEGIINHVYDINQLRYLLSGLEKMSKDPRYEDLLKAVLKKSQLRDWSDFALLKGKSLGQLLVENYPNIQLPSLEDSASSSSARDAASSNMARHRVASAVAQRGFGGLLEDDVDELVRGIEKF